MAGGWCSRCRRARAKDGQRYCDACHAAYMRTWRAGNGRRHACACCGLPATLMICRACLPAAGQPSR
jgi:hypothetical protein